MEHPEAPFTLDQPGPTQDQVMDCLAHRCLRGCPQAHPQPEGIHSTSYGEGEEKLGHHGHGAFKLRGTGSRRQLAISPSPGHPIRDSGVLEHKQDSYWICTAVTSIRRYLQSTQLAPASQGSIA